MKSSAEGRKPGRIAVHVHLRSAQRRLEWQGEVLHAWLNSPPVEGAANAELLEAVAHFLSVRLSAVRLAGGVRSRDKVIEIEGYRA